jgi:VanZ family protein
MGIRLHPGYMIAAVGYMAGLFALSAAPPDIGGSGALGSPLAWNLLHVPVYGGLACLVLLGLNDGRWRGSAWRLHGWTALVCVLHALLDEWHQSFVPGRQSSFADVLLNCIGIAGALLFSRLVGARSRPR